MTENNTIDTSITTIKKLVPQRGCCLGCGRAFSTVKGKPASQVNTVLCSAPWYSNTRLISFSKEKLKIIVRQKVIRITPLLKFTVSQGLPGSIPVSTVRPDCASKTSRQG